VTLAGKRDGSGCKKRAESAIVGEIMASSSPLYHLLLSNGEEVKNLPEEAHSAAAWGPNPWVSTGMRVRRMGRIERL